MTTVPKLSYEESLEKAVVSNEKCMGCGACVIVCPFACLDYVEEKPKLAKKCEKCGICAKVCPRFEWQPSAVESFVFGRERKPEETFGVYRHMTIAQASDEELRRKCQDGGVVTALLKFALEKGLVEAAVVSGLAQDKPLLPHPALATNTVELLACAGTRYTYSPNLFALKEGIAQKKKNLAYVGTPCQIQTIRRMEMASLKRYVEPIKFTIGLMCTESFAYEGLVRHIQQTLGVSLGDIAKMNIKGQLLITTKSGGIKAAPLKEVKKYTRQGCLPCHDFSGEFADISTGGLGMNNWTFVIVRTIRGEEIFRDAEKAGVIKTRLVETEKFASDLLVKLSEKKRNKPNV
jgi:coenzyme F420 hydrogenase subunit beta